MKNNDTLNRVANAVQRFRTEMAEAGITVSAVELATVNDCRRLQHVGTDLTVLGTFSPATPGRDKDRWVCSICGVDFLFPPVVAPPMSSGHWGGSYAWGHRNT